MKAATIPHGFRVRNRMAPHACRNSANSGSMTIESTPQVAPFDACVREALADATVPVAGVGFDLAREAAAGRSCWGDAFPVPRNGPCWGRRRGSGQTWSGSSRASPRTRRTSSGPYSPRREIGLVDAGRQPRGRGGAGSHHIDRLLEGGHDLCPGRRELAGTVRRRLVLGAFRARTARRLVPTASSRPAHDDFPFCP